MLISIENYINYINCIMFSTLKYWSLHTNQKQGYISFKYLKKSWLYMKQTVYKRGKSLMITRVTIGSKPLFESTSYSAQATLDLFELPALQFVNMNFYINFSIVVLQYLFPDI